MSKCNTSRDIDLLEDLLVQCIKTRQRIVHELGKGNELDARTSILDRISRQLSDIVKHLLSFVPSIGDNRKEDTLLNDDKHAKVEMESLLKAATVHGTSPSQFSSSKELLSSASRSVASSNSAEELKEIRILLVDIKKHQSGKVHDRDAPKKRKTISQTVTIQPAHKRPRRSRR